MAFIFRLSFPPLAVCLRGGAEWTRRHDSGKIIEWAWELFVTKIQRSPLFCKEEQKHAPHNHWLNRLPSATWTIWWGRSLELRRDPQNVAPTCSFFLLLLFSATRLIRCSGGLCTTKEHHSHNHYKNRHRILLGSIWLLAGGSPP